MRITNLSQRIRKTSHRPAFTLVELMIVIAIIVILAALTTGAAMRFYGVQQQKNSEVTVTKVYEALKEQWDTVIRQAQQEPISPQAMALANYGSTGNLITTTSIGNDAQARAIHIKLRLKQEFPMDFTEILSPYYPPYGVDLPPLRMYQDAVVAMANAGSIPWYQPSPTYQAPPLENATCLYLALQRSRGGVSFNFDNLGSNALAGDSTGYQKWIVDGWKTPIIYYRWPTSNLEVNGLNPALPGSPQATFRDPQDPTGALLNQMWWLSNHNWPIWTPFEHQLHPLVWQGTPPNPTWFAGPYPGNSGPFPDPTLPPTATYLVPAYEYYTIPVVASAGPNKSFGIGPTTLYNPTSGVLFSNPNVMKSDGSTDDNDNIYSYRLRLGARGD
jgi:prepilin-type N-terminal cleavage/methylation domain-containing protein